MENNSIAEVFGHKVRVRACGLLFKNDKLLLIKHQMDNRFLWSPPGGGVEFGASVEETLIREFGEETGMEIRVKKFLFFTEHIHPPLHAIELFYHVEADDFNHKLGTEPELSGKNILLDLRFIGAKEFSTIDRNELHSCLKSCTNPIELLDKQGHLK